MEPVNLIEEARALVRRQPLIGTLYPFLLAKLEADTDLLSGMLAHAVGSNGIHAAILSLTRSVFEWDAEATEVALADIAATTERNMEPGGQITTLLFARGIHALVGHRVVHSLWRSDRRDLALGLKTLFSRAFSTDIHPAAEFGRRIFLDHGVGLVVGETAVIEDDVSLWHGVTLGSTLKHTGDRHPKIRKGAVIGADAVVLGNVEVGAHAVVAAGSVVLNDVPENVTVAGMPAYPKKKSDRSFSGF
jgi:serine O-acetyltransferase